MDENPARIPLSATSAPVRFDALDRLTWLGPRGALVAIIAGLTLSFFALGYFAIYWRNADMDFMVVYNAFLLNDGKPQHFFDHPAYLTILSVKAAFQLLHALGLLDAYTLSAIPSANDPAAFEAAMTHAVRAGRLVAWLTATGCLLIFAALMRRIVRDWRVAMLATFAFAFSGGIAVHVRILRSEMISAGCLVIALLLLIVVGRRASQWRPLWLAMAGALCVLGLENKVNAVLLIAALPVALLPFGGPDSASTEFWRRSGGWGLALAFAVAAVASISAAWPIIAAGLDPTAVQAAGLTALFGRPGTYQALLLLWIVAGMIAFATVWRISPAETLAAICAAFAGAALALLALKLSYNINNVIAVFNPLEKAMTYADPATARAADGGLTGALWLLLDGVRLALARWTFVLHSSARPTIFLTWLIIPGLVVAWRRGERQATIQAAILLLIALGIDAIGIRRNLKTEYFIFTDPLIILAGAVLLDRMTDLGLRRWAYPIGASLALLHVVLANAEPVHYLLKQSGKVEICVWTADYLPLLPPPWCASPPRS
ncbi:hypothetical protein [Bradyrhizobium prioriisuperbiae]|uniref:hypothetical protein n=1 Tax=Bradyrhizobium prioriisuperbiae TaxID=2854389 RepID=UPI0028E71761|nr:hypothetical protein [Bradyrhizobium prioritasuperba]